MTGGQALARGALAALIEVAHQCPSCTAGTVSFEQRDDRSVAVGLLGAECHGVLPDLHRNARAKRRAGAPRC